MILNSMSKMSRNPPKVTAHSWETPSAEAWSWMHTGLNVVNCSTCRCHAKPNGERSFK